LGHGRVRVVLVPAVQPGIGPGEADLLACRARGPRPGPSGAWAARPPAQASRGRRALSIWPAVTGPSKRAWITPSRSTTSSHGSVLNPYSVRAFTGLAVERLGWISVGEKLGLRPGFRAAPPRS